jgi:hypothetical protein
VTEFVVIIFLFRVFSTFIAVLVICRTTSGYLNHLNRMDENCDPSYPDVYIASPPPDLNCDDVPYKNIKVVGDDPHGFDGDSLS